jgi:UDP-GlcNAc3NAcA epimerase
LTDSISDILFCPTDTSIFNLNNEGIRDGNVKVIKNGDVMQDAAIYYADKSEERSTIIKQMGLGSNDFVLATLHRQENTDDLNRLTAIIKAFNNITKEVKLIIPLHPRTRKIIERENISTNFSIIDPVGYFDMLELLKNCKMVLTDSGGLQKEAYFFNKYCITLRNETEWVELIQNGFNQLAGADTEKILESFRMFSNMKLNKYIELYGGGKAAEIISETLAEIS